MLVVLLSLIVLAGWQFDQPMLRELIPGAPATTPLTAFLLFSLGIALFLINQLTPEGGSSSGVWLRGAVWLLAGTAVSFSLFSLTQFLFSLNPSLELLLYPTLVQQLETDFPGRPSPHTAINGMICGCALLSATIRHPQAQKLTTALTLSSLSIPWVVIFGYLTFANPLYALQNSPQTGMSPITAVSYLIFAAGLLTLRPQASFLNLLCSDSPGSRVVRWFLPFILLMTIIFGWIFQFSGPKGWFDPTLGFTISWAVGSLGFILLILQQGFSLHRQFQERKLTIEEKEKMLQKLAKEEEKSRTLLESAPNALVIVNEMGRIVIVNKQTEHLFQYEREELINQPIETLLPERFKKDHPGQRNEFFSNPHARPVGNGSDIYGRRRDGSEFPAEVTLNVLQSPEGTLALATVRDVTEQRLAAETLQQFNNVLEARAEQMTAELRQRNREIELANKELQHYTEALEQSNRELQQFAYVASHDLQTPLRNISGFVQLLQEEYQDKLDQQAHEWIDITVENTNRMQTLIRDILAYSRVESPTQSTELVDLNEVFHEVCAMLNPLLDESEANVQADTLPQVLGNRTQLILLMQNLISNGVKYNHKPHPQIHIRAQEKAQQWVIAVQDNGIGIDTAYFTQIFDIFRRLHSQDEYPGNGIGLAICRRVVERHGGTIWIESEPNRGSTFYFSLPKKQKAQATSP